MYRLKDDANPTQVASLGYTRFNAGELNIWCKNVRITHGDNYRIKTIVNIIVDVDDNNKVKLDIYKFNNDRVIKKHRMKRCPKSFISDLICKDLVEVIR